MILMGRVSLLDGGGKILIGKHDLDTDTTSSSTTIFIITRLGVVISGHKRGVNLWHACLSIITRQFVIQEHECATVFVLEKKNHQT